MVNLFAIVYDSNSIFKDNRFLVCPSWNGVMIATSHGINLGWIYFSLVFRGNVIHHFYPEVERNLVWDKCKRGLQPNEDLGVILKKSKLVHPFPPLTLVIVIFQTLRHILSLPMRQHCLDLIALEEVSSLFRTNNRWIGSGLWPRYPSLISQRMFTIGYTLITFASLFSKNLTIFGSIYFLVSAYHKDITVSHVTLC